MTYTNDDYKKESIVTMVEQSSLNLYDVPSFQSSPPQLSKSSGKEMKLNWLPSPKQTIVSNVPFIAENHDWLTDNEILVSSWV